MNNKYLIQKLVFTASALIFVATLAIVAITNIIKYGSEINLGI